LNAFDNLSQVKETFDREETLFIGYNPGFGSGYEPLLKSWSLDLLFLINLNYKVVFTQASDFSDLRGEKRVLERLFDDKINVFLPDMVNPYHGSTVYTTDANAKNKATQEDPWCCANHSFYGLQGWKKD